MCDLCTASPTAGITIDPTYHRQTYRFSNLTLDLVNQGLWGQDPAICIIQVLQVLLMHAQA
jgi:hypothetical protein